MFTVLGSKGGKLRGDFKDGPSAAAAAVVKLPRAKKPNAARVLDCAEDVPVPLAGCALPGAMSRRGRSAIASVSTAQCVLPGAKIELAARGRTATVPAADECVAGSAQATRCPRSPNCVC